MNTPPAKTPCTGTPLSCAKACKRSSKGSADSAGYRMPDAPTPSFQAWKRSSRGSSSGLSAHGQPVTKHDVTFGNARARSK